MSTFFPLADLNDIVLSCLHSLRASDVCLACLHEDGRLELLTGGWEGVLGYSQAELDGRWLYSLLAGGRDAGRAAVRRLLDPLEPDPVLIDVLMKGGEKRTLSVYRRLDPYEPALYFACEPFEGKGPPAMSLASRSMSFFSSP